MTNESQFNDRAQEASWVFHNRKNVAQKRPVPIKAEVLPGKGVQGRPSSLHGRTVDFAAVSLPAFGKTHRSACGHQRSDLEIEYTWTNLG